MEVDLSHTDNNEDGKTERDLNASEVLFLSAYKILPS